MVPLRGKLAWATATLVGVFVFLLGFQSVVSLFDRFSSPRYYHDIISVEVKPTTVASGQELHTTVHLNRNTPDYCLLLLHRFVSNADTGEVVFSQIVPGIAAANGDQTIKRIFRLPKLPPGKYFYFFRATNDCSNFQIVTSSRQVPFEITE